MNAFVALQYAATIERSFTTELGPYGRTLLNLMHYHLRHGTFIGWKLYIFSLDVVFLVHHSTLVRPRIQWWWDICPKYVPGRQLYIDVNRSSGCNTMWSVMTEILTVCSEYVGEKSITSEDHPNVSQQRAKVAYQY